MSNTIGVCLYGYQSKNIIDSLNNLLKKSSGNNKLLVNIIDQNNIERSRKISNEYTHIKIKYNFIKWDSIISPIFLKNKIFKSLNVDYYLEIGDGIFLNDNWDEYLIKNIKDNEVLSGNKSISVIKKNLFQLDKRYQDGDSLSNSIMIDRDFIFSKYSTYNSIEKPIYLKYNGEEESMSIDLLEKEIVLKCLFTGFYSNFCKDLSLEQYVPFSLNHGYNLFIEKYREKIKKYYGLDLLSLPFNTDDVLYSIDRSKIDKIGGNRYLNKIKVIN